MGAPAPPQPPADTPATPAAPAPAAPNEGWATITQIVAAVGTGIGVLGFVTAFGGAVVWLRAQTAHLPGNEVAAVVPKEVLIATGAAFLVPAVGAAVLAALVLWLIDRALKFSAKREADAQSQRAAQLARRAGEVQEQLDGLLTAVEQRRRRATADELTAPLDASELDDLLRLEEEAAESRVANLRQARLELAETSAAARVASDNAAIAQAAADELSAAQQKWRALAGGVALFAIQLGGAVKVASGLSFGHFVALALVAVVTSAVSLSVFATNDRIGVFLLAAFISIGCFIGVLTYERIRDTPKVEPGAVLRANHVAVPGFFVARTDSRTFLAALPSKAGASYVIELEGKDVARVAVGPLLSKTLAKQRALTMAATLCRQDVADAVAAAAAKAAASGGTAKKGKGTKASASAATTQQAAPTPSCRVEGGSVVKASSKTSK